jgi:hypothetical protein
LSRGIALRAIFCYIYQKVKSARVAAGGAPVAGDMAFPLEYDRRVSYIWMHYEEKTSR